MARATTLLAPLTVLMITTGQALAGRLVKQDVASAHIYKSDVSAADTFLYGSLSASSPEHNEEVRQVSQVERDAEHSERALGVTNQPSGRVSFSMPIPPRSGPAQPEPSPRPPGILPKGPIPKPLPAWATSMNPLILDQTSPMKGVVPVGEYLVKSNERREELTALNVRYWNKVISPSNEDGSFSYGVGFEGGLEAAENWVPRPENFQVWSSVEQNSASFDDPEQDTSKAAPLDADAQLNVAKNAVNTVETLQDELVEAKRALDAEAVQLSVNVDLTKNLWVATAGLPDGPEADKKLKELDAARNRLSELEANTARAARAIQATEKKLRAAKEHAEQHLGRANVMIFGMFM